MTKRKQKETGGMVLRWARVVDEIARADDDLTRPSVQQITLVAHHRMLHASADGGECYPAQTTLANKCGITPQSVRAVDKWLEHQGLMKLVRRRHRGLKEYRLKIPDSSLDNHLEAGALNSSAELDGQVDSFQIGAQTTTTSSPPTEGRREEERTRPPNGDPRSPSARAKQIIEAIADESGVAIHALPELCAAIEAIPGAPPDQPEGWAKAWPDSWVVELAVAKAKQARTNPSRYVATGLCRYLEDPPVPPKWVRLWRLYKEAWGRALLLEELYGIDIDSPWHDRNCTSAHRQVIRRMEAEVHIPSNSFDDEDVCRLLPAHVVSELLPIAERACHGYRDWLYEELDDGF